MIPPSLWPIRPRRRAVDLAPRLEERDSGENVAGEIIAGRGRRAPGRAADAAVIETQHGHSTAGQRVGQHQERLVLEDRLVAVLRARAADQYQSRERPRSLGLGQCPGQGHSPGLVLVADLDHLVRKRSLGRLRPAQLGGLIGLLQGQRKAVARLGPRAGRLGPFGVQLALVPAQQCLHFEGQGRRVEGDRIDLQSLGALVGAVHLGCQLALGRLADVHDNAQAQARTDAQLSFPGLLWSGRISVGLRNGLCFRIVRSAGSSQRNADHHRRGHEPGFAQTVHHRHTLRPLSRSSA